MPRSISLSSQAEKSFNKFDDRVRDRVVNTLRELAENPLMGKRLKGKFAKSKAYSYRVWPCRIIYTFDQSTLNIAEIGHRKEVYR